MHAFLPPIVLPPGYLVVIIVATALRVLIGVVSARFATSKMRRASAVVSLGNNLDELSGTPVEVVFAGLGDGDGGHGDGDVLANSHGVDDAFL